MTDIAKLRALVAKPEHAGKSADDILTALSGPIPQPKAPATLAELEGVEGVTLAELKEALQPKVMPPAMRSPDGAPGAWRVEPDTDDRFHLWWDNGGQPGTLFDSVADAIAWQRQWFIDNPAVPA